HGLGCAAGAGLGTRRQGESRGGGYRVAAWSCGRARYGAVLRRAPLRSGTARPAGAHCRYAGALRRGARGNARPGATRSAGGSRGGAPGRVGAIRRAARWRDRLVARRAGIQLASRAEPISTAPSPPLHGTFVGGEARALRYIQRAPGLARVILRLVHDRIERRSRWAPGSREKIMRTRVWLPISIGALLFAHSVAAQYYLQTDLVSDERTTANPPDPHLVNAWGLVSSATSPWWVANNGTLTSTLYDATGARRTLVVTIPGPPTGVVFNGGAGFVVRSGASAAPARFIFATEDGKVAGWAPTVPAPGSTQATVAVNNSA